MRRPALAIAFGFVGIGAAAGLTAGLPRLYVASGDGVALDDAIGSAAFVVPAGSLGPRRLIVRRAAAHDVSAPLGTRLADGARIQSVRRDCEAARVPCDASERQRGCPGGTGCGTSPRYPDVRGAVQAPESAAAVVPSGAAIEQTSQGTRPAALLLESFDGHGFGMAGPHGTVTGNNPSDNSLAVGPDHIVEIVNSRMAVYTKEGEQFERSGTVLFGPIATNVLFSGFGGECELRPNGDAVVRYDQLAERWLYVMPLFRRATVADEASRSARAGRADETTDPDTSQAPYGMCYALSAGPNPLGPYYRYYFERDLFPDYPRPAIWPDGYYVPTSTGDDVIEKHACVVDRAKMLQGLPATEQCVIVPDVNFLNNADIDGPGLPPAGAPNVVMATGGSQLREVFRDDGIYAWNFHVDWDDPTKTRLDGPLKIAVAPYNYLCNGQLTRCVPQPGTEMRLDAQGDKIMQRLVYRNADGRESIVAVHSVATAAGGGGVRWYEFRLNESREPVLHQQGTYAPDGYYRWMASPAMDRRGNIGIGYSFGGTPHYAGQRFAGRLVDDALGLLTFHETVLVEGEESQTSTLRWEDYTQTAMDPVDDCTIWYVGDYLKKGAPSYTTRIGAFRLSGCLSGTVTGATYFDINHNGIREANEPGLPGWRLEYTGALQGKAAAEPPSGTLTTEESGDFSITLPADPAYFDPTYSFSAPAPENPGWTQIESGTAYSSAGAVPMTGRSYTIELKDRDAVTHVSFGSVCIVTNVGGAGPAYWLTDRGKAVLAANDEAPVEPERDGRLGRGDRDAGGWRNLLNLTVSLIDADGTPFEVPAGTFDEAFARFQSWVESGASTNASHALSVQLAATTLNIAYGDQDGDVTANDPIEGDWPTVESLLARVSGFSRDDPPSPDAAIAGAYATLLEALNGNTAAVTPTTPAGCPPPF